MKVIIERWEVERNIFDKYIKKEHKTLTGTAADIMRDYRNIKNIADLANHTPWQITDIQD